MLALLCAASVIPSPSGCIRDNMDDCYCESHLYIIVETESVDFAGTIDRATVYLFDKNGAWYSSIVVDATDIAEGRPVPVTYNRTNPPWVAVWANAGDATLISQPSAGAAAQSLFVSMIASSDGYGVPADRLFFGGKRLTGAVEEIIAITPKTGRISVTARGLPAGDPADRYYFTAVSPYDSYDFSGEPLRGPITVNLPAVLQGNDPVTDQAYHLFHFPAPPPDGESLTIRLYRVGAAATDAELLAEAGEDIDGQPIVIQRERTTNVLMNVESGGQIDIYVVVGGWEEIHQWDVW